MRKVRLSTGYEISLDGELLSILEALYRELTLKHELKVSFQDMMREVEALVDQMDDADRRRYLIESLFLNSVTYENEMLDAYMRKITSPDDAGADDDAGEHS
jgi:hypothetical protein